VQIAPDDAALGVHRKMTMGFGQWQAGLVETLNLILSKINWYRRVVCVGQSVNIGQEAPDPDVNRLWYSGVQV
jgi:hypothetical protein